MPLHPLKAEWDAGLIGGDPLQFPGYDPPPEESVRTGRTDDYALIEGRFDVLGGSMGAAHGEKVVRALRRRATDESLPVVVITASGGARLQEGMVALGADGAHRRGHAQPRRGRAAPARVPPCPDHRRRLCVVRESG